MLQGRSERDFDPHRNENKKHELPSDFYNLIFPATSKSL